MDLSPHCYRSVLEALPTGVYLVDLERRIILWSKGAEELTGYLAHEVVGRCCRDDLLIHCDENAACLCGQACPLQETMHDGNPRTVDLFLLHKSGHRVPVTIHAAPLHGEHGTIIGAIECFDRRPLFRSAEPFACQPDSDVSTDEWTGLPDRPATEARLGVYLQIHDSSGIPFGVISVAVPSLDLVRQKKGYEAVHAALQAVGQTLAGALGPGDMIGRWSDQRFLVVVTSCTTSSLVRFANMAKRLVSSGTIPWWGDRISVSLSIGGAIVRPGDTPQMLVGRAEAALERSLPQSDGVVVD